METKAKVTMVRGTGAQALRDALAAGMVAPDIEDSVIRTEARNEALEHENAILWRMNREKDAQLKEQRLALLERCKRRMRPLRGRHARVDVSGYVILSATIGAVLTSLVFCAVVWGRWFA